MDCVSHVVVDWGTSSFRLWALNRAGGVLAERRSAQGLLAAASEGFEHVLDSHLAALSVPEGVPVMMCGMVGARAGWVEAAYMDAPARLDRLAEQAAQVPSARRPIRILPGIAQRGAGEADVMRGEETQLLALVGDGFEGLACLPGTHSKWVVVAQGQVQRFATFLTGELFHLLRSGSVIAPAVEAAAVMNPRAPAFARGVEDGLAAPETLANRLFRLRASWLLEGTAPADTLARLSGLLVGSELAGAARQVGTLANVALVASGPAAEVYEKALALAGVPGVVRHDAERLVRSGLHAAALSAFRLERASA
ncbi:2-dehydro-3-deoxygalactonokinase [Ancylobacter dichloromethanicus]|uniref:2-dehydro-3-deoxygalactonokinase n=1 Tax=Ancylobacter dichloromethanicus TaxID=518825 RepID=A0A9W6MYY1_9HYPH|nr:2-dehydro-3-deoxygalactonokinase [Ancylobacter dichloromethanicus]MBS7554302.1 2-dehydro-3-deoxygalactonokinase [Ancylobacter dichloromethanicus]GLK71427.1 2-dehydro-3-deoxygalactonokinase [Ancylobacter dichloromethanicus]